MIWWAQWGASVEALQAIAAAGAPVKALENKPPLRPDDEAYLRCYIDTSSDRSFNGSLTFAAVSNWCLVYGAPVGEFWEVLRSADDGVRRWRDSH